jgi:hypothetical protein
VAVDAAHFEPVTYAEELYTGVDEYAVSGWAKWVNPAKVQAWNLLFRLTTTGADTLTNTKNPGDRTLLVNKNPEAYHFSTYSCQDEENTCAPNVVQTVPFGEQLPYWTYFYFGYSAKHKRAYGYI